MPIKRERKVLVGGHYLDRSFTIYTQEEADAHGIEYKPWRQGREPGEWVMDDGGWVSQVIRAKLYHVGKTKKYPKWRITLSYGPFFATRQRLDYAEWADYKPDYKAQEAKKARSKRTAKAYAKVFMEREGRLTPEDLRTLGRLYRADQKIPEASLKRWLKIEQVQNMIAQELAALLSKKGVEKGDIIDRYNTVYDAAITEGQLSVAKSVVDKLADMLDMKPDKTQVSGGIEMSGVSFPEIPEWAGDMDAPSLPPPEEVDLEIPDPDVEALVGHDISKRYGNDLEPDR